ncbi:MAG: hypothetical protein IT424_03730 [Pirellulales bacterium]|nr:hypothetical protein [Pirellulales bacterium]
MIGPHFLTSAFTPRRADAAEFAIAVRVVLIAANYGIPIDVSLGALPYEEGLVERASRFEYLSGVPLVTASAEDLVILKAFAGRGKDWVDVENILIRQMEKLDWDLITGEPSALCELRESPEKLGAVAAP